MFRSGNDVIEWVNQQLRFGIKPGLERMNAALARLDSPHLKIKTIHIAGTNGKGSTVTYLRSVLQDAGYMVGTFTSPYIETFNERISINGVPISNDDLAWCANVVKPIVEEINKTDIGPFTEFELITLISFVYFKNQPVDVVIYEVGLGGRLDATNIIEPLVCGITNIGHDHEAILGDTLEKIAIEKLGIMKHGVPLFTTEDDEEVLTVFKAKCEEKQSPYVNALMKYVPQNVESQRDGITFDWINLSNVKLHMKGSHQVKNATLAYSMLEYLKEKRIFNISEVNIYRGMNEAFWKGRFELIHERPDIILDGAHNPEGMKHLTETIAHLYPNSRHIFMVSVLKDKDYTEMFDSLSKVADEVHFTTFDYPRAQSGKHQFESYPLKNADYEEDYELLLEKLLDCTEEEDCLVITGSLYFISEVRKYLMK